MSLNDIIMKLNIIEHYVLFHSTHFGQSKNIIRFLGNAFKKRIVLNPHWIQVYKGES